MMANMGSFSCIFCAAHILVTDLRDYISTTKYKQLTDKEVDHLFQLEISMLDDTKTALNEEQRFIEAETMIRWMRKDGMTGDQIFNTLLEMGYMKARINKQLSLTYTCPKCSNILCHSNDESSIEYICENCNVVVCGICIEEKNLNHECDNDVLKTLKHIHSTCETCPKCHTVIEKESGGCDQMFCTKCKTTFSWTTKRIVLKGEVHHNPHFYDWQRLQQGESRHPLDNPCEGPFLIKCQDVLNSAIIIPESLADVTLNKIYDGKIPLSVDKGSYLKFVQGMLMHSVETIVEIQERDDFIRYQFRIRYITKRFSFKKWKMRFKQHINTLRRNNETKTLLLTCLDSLYFIVLHADADTFMIEQLFSFITQSLKDVQNKYGRTINYVINTENVVLPYMA
jgi:hypothetical protein